MIPEHQSLNLVDTHCFDDWLGYFTRKKKQTGGWGFTFKKKPWIFLNLAMEIPGKTKRHRWQIHKIALDPLEITKPNHKPMEISHYFSLVILGNFLCYFFVITEYSISPPIWFSSGITHLKTTSWLPSYLTASKHRRFLRTGFSPSVQ